MRGITFDFIIKMVVAMIILVAVLILIFYIMSKGGIALNKLLNIIFRA